MRVLGGQVSFRFKNDRLFVIGSEALPRVSATPPRRPIVDAAVTEAALGWIRRDFAPGAVAEGRVTGPFVLPLVRQGRIDYAVVLATDVRATSPIGLWTVYVDAATAAPVARRSRLKFADGTMMYNAPVRRPGSTRMDYPAHQATMTVDGGSATSTYDGLLTWTGAGSASVTSTVLGPFVRVNNDNAAEVTGAFTLDPGGTQIWNRMDSELDDAQLTSFIHANRVKTWSRAVAPTMTWLDEQIEVTVNINDVCNAFSDGDSINFFRAGGGCANTGRLPDVIYHEFGHSFHAHAIIPGAGDFETALSEGIGDYVAATIVNDSGMGRGFFNNNSPLRDVGPDLVWPEDIHPDPHETGLIWAGAMWDLRAALIDQMGYDEGVALADHLMYESIRRSSDIPSTYVETLAADDDNGDIMDGTPNMCAINAAFSLHGLAPAGVEGGPGVQRPTLEGLKVDVAVITSTLCPGTAVQSAEVAWQRREDDKVGGVIQMTPNATGYEATMPAQPPGTVVQYQVTVTLENGDVLEFPANPADPMYETFVGEVIPLYCTDFELDPASEGWTHGLTSGTPTEGADDWQWGAPQGMAGSGDPAAAYSGGLVFGNDLGGGNYNGMYQADKVNFALSPGVDTQEYTNIRLQYRRWLNVEDAMYDHATIYANDELAWVNLATAAGSVNHTDREWRFHDVDLSPFVADGSVAVKFEIQSDGGLELGGWTLDDLCVVAFVAPDPVCGNGYLEGAEACDDGNTTNGDGCEADCTTTPAGPYCGDGTVDEGEQCDDGNDIDDDECTNACTTPTGLGGDDSGCGCRAAGRGAPSGAWVLAGLGLGLGLALVRRRRR
jgi:cysteine-rich repeat protein